MIKDEHDVPDDMKTVFDWCQEGDINYLTRFLNQSPSKVDSVDEEGEICEALVYLLHAELSIPLRRSGQL